MHHVASVHKGSPLLRIVQERLHLLAQTVKDCSAYVPSDGEQSQEDLTRHSEEYWAPINLLRVLRDSKSNGQDSHNTQHGTQSITFLCRLEEEEYCECSNDYSDHQGLSTTSVQEPANSCGQGINEALVDLWAKVLCHFGEHNSHVHEEHE